MTGCSCIDTERFAVTLEEAWRNTLPPRLLLAEDDFELRTMLAQNLRKDGYQVIEAKDGAQLVDLLRSWLVERRAEPIDLVVSDNRMPGWSGLEFLRSLRQADWAIPVVLITAFGDEDLHREARRLGAAAVLDKPFDVEDLRTVVLDALPSR
jgi:CheY-like chemotaxis protein